MPSVLNRQLQPYEAVAYATAKLVDPMTLEKILVEAKNNLAISTSADDWDTVVAALIMLSECQNKLVLVPQ